ncbi:FIST N-terminal domain-containing protein [Gemmobacter sp. 24YEA27]|uniref:FIST N-terminal domain-containing protein n=1 Tax=Gemmobacter sp. 24YEA27 TaxID=3040672 RepID=UPI0024B35AA1|nr:FIST N-terminal domain-containing protein [Gemmobacter sp. 24YEA27]
MEISQSGRPARPIAASARGGFVAVSGSLICAFADLDPALILVFADDQDLVTPLTGALHDAFGAGCKVLGCSSAGGFCFDGYQEDSVVAIAFPASSFRAEAVCLRGLRQHVTLDWMVSLRGLMEKSRGHAGKSRFGLLLIDGSSGCEELVTTTVDASLPDLMVLGGSAGDGLRFEQTRLAMDGVEYAESALFCVINTDFDVKEVIFDHFVPVGNRMVVTSANPETRLIHEINAEPAAEEYARLIDVRVDELGPSAFAENPLLECAGGRHYVRAISGVTPNGDLALMCSIEPGAILTLGRSESLTEGLRRQMEQIGPAELVLGFDCILRRIAVERAGEQETVGKLCRDFRVAGFNTYGEQHGGIHVNQTFVGLAILDDSASRGMGSIDVA